MNFLMLKIFIEQEYPQLPKVKENKNLSISARFFFKVRQNYKINF